MPEKDYKVRADYLSQQHWSDVFSWQDVGVDINHGTAILHVTHNGQDLYDVPVYLFTESGSYLGRLERTDSSGQVQFLLPANSYKFRVDYEGTQYWSDVISIIPHEENNIDLQLELLADLTNVPNPDRFDGVPPVYEQEKVMVASLGSIRGLLVHSVVGQTTGGQELYYFINDHLGTPHKLLNKNADVVWSADYKPFGEADVYVNTYTNNFRFPGQYYDAETGLHYNYFRYYDPMTGRYLTPDPIGLAGGINLFIYTQNDPVNAVDPLGLIRWGTVGKGAFATFGGGVAVAGGALASTTGVGAIGGVPAILVGSAGLGWGVSQMIAGFLDNEIPFMGTKEAIIKSSTDSGLLQDELLGVNALGDMLLTGRTAPTDIGKINDALQSGYSIYESGSKILDGNSGSSECP